MARSARDPRTHLRPPGWSGGERRGARAGHGGASGPRRRRASKFADCLGKLRPGSAAAPCPISGPGPARRCRPERGPGPADTRSPACRGHVSLSLPRSRRAAPARRLGGSARAAMGIQGMELCAVAVVVLLFIAVLKQFGILEPISMEGNVWPSVPLPSAGAGVRGEGAARASGWARLAAPPRPPPGFGGLGLGLMGQRGLGPE